MQIADMAAIVTGGASGLGAATARMLASKGGLVTLFDINEKEGEKLASEIGGLFKKVDVTIDDEVIAAVKEVEGVNGPARILVNCAGIAPFIRTLRPVVPHPMDAFRHVIETNLVGTFSVLSAFADRLQHHGSNGEDRGVVINTASIAAFDGQVGHAAYAASKAGIVGMTLPLARDLASTFIRVMTIAPGLFETAMLADVPGKDRVALCSQVPHPARAGLPEEFASLVEAIVTIPMLNGEVIRIDGAMRMAPF